MRMHAARGEGRARRARVREVRAADRPQTHGRWPVSAAEMLPPEPPKKTTKKAFLIEDMPRACDAAGAGLRFSLRQLFYQARPAYIRQFGEELQLQDLRSGRG